MSISSIMGKVICILAALAWLGFNLLLYRAFELQKGQMEELKAQQQIQAQVEGNQLKYQQGQIERLRQELTDNQQQSLDFQKQLAAAKDQTDTIQTSLVDIKAEADAIKQSMKSWQKDQVTVLAEMEKKMDGYESQINQVHHDIDSLNIPGLRETIESLKADLEKPAAGPKTDTTETNTGSASVSGDTASVSAASQ